MSQPEKSKRSAAAMAKATAGRAWRQRNGKVYNRKSRKKEGYVDES